MNTLNSSRPPHKRRSLIAGEEIAQHRDYLFNYALGRLRNRDLAEDAMQESYLAALAGADKFLKKSSGRTWMTSILKHKVYDQVRRACRDRAIFASDSSGMHDESNNLAATVADPSTELDRKELRDAIEEALSELPARLEKAFTLYESEEWSSREVCAELGISENNLWIILHRARKKLREQLSEWQTLTCSGQIALT